LDKVAQSPPPPPPFDIDDFPLLPPPPPTYPPLDADGRAEPLSDSEEVDRPGVDEAQPLQAIVTVSQREQTPPPPRSSSTHGSAAAIEDELADPVLGPASPQFEELVRTYALEAGVDASMVAQAREPVARPMTFADRVLRFRSQLLSGARQPVDTMASPRQLTSNPLYRRTVTERPSQR
jgi:hypothetical protein